MAKKTTKNEMVTIVCGGQIERMTRQEGINKYYECMLCCEGSEGERYKSIYCQLMEGKTVCDDRLGFYM